MVQQVSKLGDELSGKELGDEEKIFEDNVNKVTVICLVLLLPQSNIR